MQTKQLVWAVALLIPTVAVVLAALGFRGREVIVGIDLGTTFSSVAYRSNSVLHVMRNNRNRTTTASVLALTNEGFVFGDAAVAHMIAHPLAGIFDSKRVIGRRWDDDTLHEENARHSGRLIPHPAVQRDVFGKVQAGKKLQTCRGCMHEPAFIVSHAQARAATSHKCVDDGSLLTYKALMDHLQTHKLEVPSLLRAANTDDQFLLLTPTACACLVINHLLDSLRIQLGHGQFKSVIATVPAEFNAAQRQVTMDAYLRAGVSPSRMLHEPAAAAIAYNLHQDPNVKYVLVFDMGGGTLDISILYAQDDAFTVLGAAGDVHLGGEDFDDCILQQLNTVVSSASSETLNEKASMECEELSLRMLAEGIKIQLGNPHVQAVPWACNKNGRTVASTFQRQDLETGCSSLFDRVLDPIKSALFSTNLAAADIDEIVLVGGSSRLLRVRELLENHFGKPLRNTVDPDLAVAIGASMVVD